MLLAKLAKEYNLALLVVALNMPLFDYSYSANSFKKYDTSLGSPLVINSSTTFCDNNLKSPSSSFLDLDLEELSDEDS
jgi:hypothetical protein